MEAEKKISQEAAATKKGAVGRELVLEAEQTSWLQSHGIDATDTSPKYIMGEPTAR